MLYSSRGACWRREEPEKSFVPFGIGLAPTRCSPGWVNLGRKNRANRGLLRVVAKTTGSGQRCSGYNRALGCGARGPILRFS
jgi:hypothetical protein